MHYCRKMNKKGLFLIRLYFVYVSRRITIYFRFRLNKMDLYKTCFIEANCRKILEKTCYIFFLSFTSLSFKSQLDDYLIKNLKGVNTYHINGTIHYSIRIFFSKLQWYKRKNLHKYINTMLKSTQKPN